MADEQKSLVAVEERSVEFYGDEIKGVRVTRTPSGKSEFYVPLRPLCNYLGVSYTGQRERVERDPVLSRKLEAVQLTTAGGPQEMQCLPLDYLNGWLFGINANRVKAEIRERLIRYQEECYIVLREAFQEPVATDSLAQVEQLGRALITLAREQRAFDHRLGGAEEDIVDVRQRVIALEERVAPGKPITEDQASHISQAVKLIAMGLGKRSGRNEYGGVYGELYRKFGITSYKALPADKYEKAVTFLKEWHQSLTDESPF